MPKLFEKNILKSKKESRKVLPAEPRDQQELAPEQKRRKEEVQKELKALVLEVKEIKQKETSALTKEDAEKFRRLEELILELQDIFKPGARRIERVSAKLREAREILGEDVLGYKEAKKAFGAELKSEDIPEPPYTTEDLKKAKELGQMLELRVNQMELDGQQVPITLENLKKKFSQNFQISPSDLYQKEKFFTKDTPKLEWKLVSKEPLPDSVHKNYFEQTKLLRDHLLRHSIIYEIDPEYISDEDIKKIKALSPRWEKQAQALAELPINQKYRNSPVEDIYDLLNYYLNTRRRLRKTAHNWTNRYSSEGQFIHVSASGSKVITLGSLPAYSNGNIGVYICR